MTKNRDKPGPSPGPDPLPTTLTDPRPAGRPHECTIDIINEFCERLASAESPRVICMDDHMPHRKTIYRWLYCETTGPDDPREIFRSRYARARSDQLTTWADDLIDIADGRVPVGDVGKQDGETVKEHQHRLTNRDRLRVDTRKWVMAKVNPARWGDKVQHVGEGGGAIKHGLTPALAELVDDIADAKKDVPMIELNPEDRVDWATGDDQNGDATRQEVETMSTTKGRAGSSD